MDEILFALNDTGHGAAERLEDFPTADTATVADIQGMHARPASLIAEQAARFAATEIRIRNGARTANAKSMASLLTMGAQHGDTLTVSASGEQAEAAIQSLVEMIDAGLDSDEDQASASYRPLTVLSALPAPQCRLTLTGSAASPGITMAPAFKLEAGKMKFDRQAENAKKELENLQRAFSEAGQQLDELKARLEATAPNEAAILQAQKQLLNDEQIGRETSRHIDMGNSAAWSFSQAIARQIEALKAVGNERLRARVADLADVRDRVLALLVPAASAAEYPESDFVLMARDLTPSQTAGLQGLNVRGICTELGGPNSHMAILARALGLPAVVGLGEGAFAGVETGQMVIVDPQASAVYVDPEQQTIDNGLAWIDQWQQIRQEEGAQKHEEAKTVDGHRLDVVCNIANPEDARKVLENGGEGVGLLRTEFLFESSIAEPTVAEQCATLQAIVRELGTRQLIVRTADIGGDKPVSWLTIPHEDNPFLGMRGIRLSLKNEGMFRRQLEAIYRTAIWQLAESGATGLHIMFPMVGRMSEWLKARDIAESVRARLGAPNLPLGIMIEVPSAVMVAEHLAREVDFFSIGSNDLTQYVLAIDRLHPDLCCEADSYHPALVKMIDQTVKAARAHGKWVGVCGNAAANPNLATLLVGLGVSELSVSPANVAAVKNIIRAVHYGKLQQKAHNAMQMGSSEAVMELYKATDDIQ
ncbi:MAG: phosphoenolpyruvate--protein phosphotransferase [Desulfopila sp.]